MRHFIAAALFALTGFSAAGAQQKSPQERAAMSRLKGAQNAPVTVYEIADFQCPYCARFAREVGPRIDSAYVRTGKVKWIYVNFPLPTHANAWSAAEAAMCAGGVGDKFWQMHDRLFAAQNEWAATTRAAALFAKYAREIGLQTTTFEGCLADDRMASIIVRDILNVSGAAVSGTPAFVINDEPLFAGYRPFDEWKEMLDAALKKARAAATSRP